MGVEFSDCMNIHTCRLFCFTHVCISTYLHIFRQSNVAGRITHTSEFQSHKHFHKLIGTQRDFLQNCSHAHPNTNNHVQFYLTCAREWILNMNTDSCSERFYLKIIIVITEIKSHLNIASLLTDTACRKQATLNLWICFKIDAVLC